MLAGSPNGGRRIDRRSRRPASPRRPRGSRRAHRGRAGGRRRRGSGSARSWLVARGPASGRKARTRRPGARARVELEPAAQQLGPLAHARQAEVTASRLAAGVEAGTRCRAPRRPGRRRPQSVTFTSTPAPPPCRLGVRQRLGQDAIHGDLRRERRVIRDPADVHGGSRAGPTLVVGHGSADDLGRRGSLAARACRARQRSRACRSAPPAARRGPTRRSASPA